MLAALQIESGIRRDRDSEDLPAKLVSSGVLRAHEPLLEASIKMAGKLAPGWQSGHVVNAGAAVHRLAGQGARAGWGATDG